MPNTSMAMSKAIDFESVFDVIIFDEDNNNRMWNAGGKTKLIIATQQHPTKLNTFTKFGTNVLIAAQMKHNPRRNNALWQKLPVVMFLLSVVNIFPSISSAQGTINNGTEDKTTTIMLTLVTMGITPLVGSWRKISFWILSYK
mmetsp:Transcript_34764/g.39627  ORF Transcript_34764/g.39627 Transcript_34764/m.39627 type:complete len:143 (+) Transcript_34764:70-498(+)